MNNKNIGHAIPKVEKRDDKFVDKTSTVICKEIPSENPYIPKKVLWHGYDVIELMTKCDYIDVLYLLLKGEFPSQEIKKCLQQVMVALANPGPRHNATRAGMCASISKTEVAHLLPISLEVMSGNYLGAGEVQASMQFISAHSSSDPSSIAKDLLSKTNKDNDRIAPGFGCVYGNAEIVAGQIAERLIKTFPFLKTLAWCNSFVKEVKVEGYGWLTPGLAAGVFIDLGFNSREGACLFQLCSAPGLMAHALEMSTRPVTDMPWISDDKYIIEKVL